MKFYFCDFKCEHDCEKKILKSPFLIHISPALWAQQMALCLSKAKYWLYRDLRIWLWTSEWWEEASEASKEVISNSVTWMSTSIEDIAETLQYNKIFLVLEIKCNKACMGEEWDWKFQVLCDTLDEITSLTQ